MADALKLRAEDEEDLAIISAILQDALVPVGDMAYFPEEKRFVFVANRFRWERAASGERPSLERILAGVCFDGVEAVKRRGFAPGEADRLLELLAVHAVPGAVLVEFAGNSCLRLEAAAINGRIEDLGEPWPTRWRPSHPLDES